MTYAGSFYSWPESTLTCPLWPLADSPFKVISGAPPIQEVQGKSHRNEYSCEVWDGLPFYSSQGIFLVLFWTCWPSGNRFNYLSMAPSGFYWTAGLWNIVVVQGLTSFSLWCSTTSLDPLVMAGISFWTLGIVNSKISTYLTGQKGKRRNGEEGIFGSKNIPDIMPKQEVLFCGICLKPLSLLCVF